MNRTKFEGNTREKIVLELLEQGLEPKYVNTAIDKWNKGDVDPITPLFKSIFEILEKINEDLQYES